MVANIPDHLKHLVLASLPNDLKHLVTKQEPVGLHDVSQQPHYAQTFRGNPTTIEPRDFINAYELPFDEGNIIKYTSRHNQKGKAKDLLKVIDYAQNILKKQYGVASAFTVLT